MVYRTYRYSQWDGTQEIFGLDAEELMDRLSDEVLKQGDVTRALRDLLRQGCQNRDGQQMPGLRDLLEQLKNRRRQQLQQYNMDAVVEDLQERLEDIIRTERAGIDRRLEEGQQQVAGVSDDERAQHENTGNAEAQPSPVDLAGIYYAREAQRSPGDCDRLPPTTSFTIS